MEFILREVFLLCQLEIDWFYQRVAKAGNQVEFAEKVCACQEAGT
jgi:hypothetical protein